MSLIFKRKTKIFLKELNRIYIDYLFKSITKTRHTRQTVNLCLLIRRLQIKIDNKKKMYRNQSFTTTLKI